MVCHTKFRRTIVMIGTIVLAVFAAGACGGQSGDSGSENDSPYTIGVSNGFIASEWRTQMLNDLEEVNAEYMEEGLTEELIVESADVDIQGQVRQIRNLINRGVDAIILNPNSQGGLDSVIQEATDAGIVVISVDSTVSAPDATNVVIDQAEFARQSASWVAEEMGGEGEVVAINGVSGTPANEIRWNAAQEVFDEAGIEVVNQVNADWDQATGQQAMADLLASQPNIDGVWVQDGMAEGALRALNSSNLDEWPVIAGEARVGYLNLWNDLREERDFTSFGVYNPPGVGASGLRVAVEMLQGNELNSGVLEGEFDNSLYVPIPGTVSEENFEEEYERVADRANSYSLDGIISREQAREYFE